MLRETTSLVRSCTIACLNILQYYEWAKESQLLLVVCSTCPEIDSIAASSPVIHMDEVGALPKHGAWIHQPTVSFQGSYIHTEVACRGVKVSVVSSPPAP